MKKNKINTFIIVFSILFTFMFTGCFDPIYHTIMTDVKPEKPTVSGNLTSIARYTTEDGKEFLITAANGGLRYKDADAYTHGNWKTYKAFPFEIIHNDFDTNSYKGEDILKVVTDKDYIYIITVEYLSETSVPSNAKIYTAKMSSKWDAKKEDWKKLTMELPIIKEEGYYRSIKSYFNVFYTNDINKENRHAYVRIGDPDAKKEEYKTVKYFRLNGANEPIDITANVKSADSENDKANKCINSAVVFNGTEYFFNSTASIASDKYIYYGNGENLYYGKPGSKFEKALAIGNPIASMATSKDAIIIGCGDSKTFKGGGIKKVALDENGKPASSLSDFTTNAVFQIQPSYAVYSLLNVTPDKKELDSNIYATVTFPGVGAGNNNDSDKGLWSYYSNRGNWNRE